MQYEPEAFTVYKTPDEQYFFKDNLNRVFYIKEHDDHLYDKNGILYKDSKYHSGQDHSSQTIIIEWYKIEDKEYYNPKYAGGHYVHKEITQQQQPEYFLQQQFVQQPLVQHYEQQQIYPQQPPLTQHDPSYYQSTYLGQEQPMYQQQPATYYTQTNSPILSILEVEQNQNTCLEKIHALEHKTDQKFKDHAAKHELLHKDVQKSIQSLHEISDEQQKMSKFYRDLLHLKTEERQKFEEKDKEISTKIAENLKILHEIKALSETHHKASTKHRQENFKKLEEKLEKFHKIYKEEKLKRKEEKNAEKEKEKAEQLLRRQDEEKKDNERHEEIKKYLQQHDDRMSQKQSAHEQKINEIMIKLKDLHETEHNSKHVSHHFFKQSKSISKDTIQDLIATEDYDFLNQQDEDIAQKFKDNIKIAKQNLKKLDRLYDSKCDLLELSDQYQKYQKTKILQEYNKIKRSKIFGDFSDLVPSL